MEAKTSLDNSTNADAFVTFYWFRPKQILQAGARGLGGEGKDGSSGNLKGH